jgi:hypothetical protein
MMQIYQTENTLVLFSQVLSIYPLVVNFALNTKYYTLISTTVCPAPVATQLSTGTLETTYLAVKKVSRYTKFSQESQA